MEASCRRVMIGQFIGGIHGGALDDGRLVQLASGLLVKTGGTDNSDVFDIVDVSSDNGENWTSEAHGGDFPARNAHGTGILGGAAVIWGGNTETGTALEDSYQRTSAGVWAQISADMDSGGVYGTVRKQFAFAQTATNFLTIGGDNIVNTVASTDLIDWTDQGDLPVALQNTGGMYADYCADRDEVWLVGGYNNNTASYQNGLWRSTDEGATWTLMLTNSIFAHKWPNLICCNWGIIYIAGSTGSNQKGAYMIDYDTLQIKRFALEPSARHASFTCHSYDGEEGFLATGNFENDAYRFVRTDVLLA